MRWSVEQRLEFIEFRLYWEGKVNRSDLVTIFNISVPQASADLTKYQEAAHGNMVYDKTAKSYVASPNFRPVFFTPSADRFLAQLRSLAGGVLNKEDTWFDRPPAFAVVPLLRRTINPESLQNVLKGIRTRTAIKIEYQSFSSRTAKRRWIAAHAIGFDGFRWHARAWCFSHNDFRDFCPRENWRVLRDAAERHRPTSGRRMAHRSDSPACTKPNVGTRDEACNRSGIRNEGWLHRSKNTGSLVLLHRTIA